MQRHVDSDLPGMFYLLFNLQFRKSGFPTLAGKVKAYCYRVMAQPVTKLASCRERQACGTTSCLSFLQWCMWCSHWCRPKRECAVFFLVNASWPKQWQSPLVFLTLTLLTPLMGIVRIMYTPSEDVKDTRPCFCLEFSSLRASLHSSPYALVELLKLLLYRHF